MSWLRGRAPRRVGFGLTSQPAQAERPERYRQAPPARRVMPEAPDAEGLDPLTEQAVTGPWGTKPLPDPVPPVPPQVNTGGEKRRWGSALTPRAAKGSDAQTLVRPARRQRGSIGRLALIIVLAMLAVLLAPMMAALVMTVLSTAG